MKQALSDAIEDYRHHRESLGVAENTLASDKKILRRFLTITGNILVENVHEGHIDTYFREVSKTGLSPRSQGVDTSTLKGFFAWAHRTRRTRTNPVAGRRSPKFMPRAWRGFPPSKIPALLDAATHPRDRILLALGCYLLGRGVEFSLLRIGDVDLEGAGISYVIPKTDKVDVMPIATELDRELRRWFRWYTEECGPLDPNWYLVPAKTPPLLQGYKGHVVGSERLIPDRPIATIHRRGTMHRIAKAALESIGFATRDENGKSYREGMHTLRRSVARGLYFQLIEEGDPNPIETVRAMLNHATEKETRNYIGVQAEREVRDKRIKGKPMFPGLVHGSNVVDLSARREARSQ